MSLIRLSSSTMTTFFNTETNDVMCGKVPYERLKEWANK